MDTNTETMTSDEQLDYTHYTDAKTTIQQKNCAETNDLVKRTLTVRQFMLGMLVTSVVTALLTSLLQWNAGYGVAKFFGLLNDDTPSGSEMYGFIEAQHEKNDFERDLSEQYHAIKDNIILGKDETIEKLHGDIESEKKQKYVLRVENEQLESDNKKLVDQMAARKDADFNLMTQNAQLKTENLKLKAEIKNSTVAYNQQAGRLGDLKKAYTALVTNFKKSTAN